MIFFNLRRAAGADLPLHHFVFGLARLVLRISLSKTGKWRQADQKASPLGHIVGRRRLRTCMARPILWTRARLEARSRPGLPDRRTYTVLDRRCRTRPSVAHRRAIQSRSPTRAFRSVFDRAAPD